VVDITTTIEIDCEAAVVAAYAVDPDNVPSWYENIKAIEWKTPKPLQIGSQIAFVAEFLGRRLEYTYEVVEWDPGVRFVMRTKDGPFPMETTYSWTPLVNGRTRMTLRNQGNPSGFSKIAAPMMAPAMRRANQKDLAAIKRVLEQSNQ